MSTNRVEAIRDITGGGVDYSLEASGSPMASHQATEALGSLGTCGIVGAEPLGTEVSFDVNNLMISGKGIRGILEGESVPDIVIPQLIELNAQGRFPFEKLTKFYSLDRINQAAKESEDGGTIKPMTRPTGSVSEPVTWGFLPAHSDFGIDSSPSRFISTEGRLFGQVIVAAETVFCVPCKSVTYDGCSTIYTTTSSAAHPTSRRVGVGMHGLQSKLSVRSPVSKERANDGGQEYRSKRK